MKCVVPCGGNSKRMSSKTNKCLLEIAHRPLLTHVVDFWRNQGVEDFIFIVGGEGAPHIIKLISQMTLRSPIILHRGMVMNLAVAVSLAAPYLDNRFVLALGDCLNIGHFIDDWNTDFGVGVAETNEEELRKNYLVMTNEGRVSYLIEKPPTSLTGLCGMGTFFLCKRVFDYIGELDLNYRATSADLTQALIAAIRNNEQVKPIRFQGTYINITYPKDLEEANECTGRS